MQCGTKDALEYFLMSCSALLHFTNDYLLKGSGYYRRVLDVVVRKFPENSFVFDAHWNKMRNYV